MEKMSIVRLGPVLHRMTRRATILLWLLCLAVAVPALAKSRKATSAVERAGVLSEFKPSASGVAGLPGRQRVAVFTFKQLGAVTPIRLRGVDGSAALPLSIRADEVVVAARLRLAYSYSPSLLAELSHLNVMVNGEVASIVPLPRDKNLANTREIELDPRLFTDYNKVQFRLIGHYTYKCEDPLHTSLWLELSNLGQLELTLAPLALTNDLKHLPAPFFDRRDNALLKLPFVFASAPSFGTLRAAGVLASWFGNLASYRGARFPTLLNALPDGHAVVFLQGPEKSGGLSAASTPTVSIEPHPTNPLAKLLLISGSSDDDLMQAVRSIAFGNGSLSGQRVSVTRDSEPPPRQPYDAPTWVPADRPVRFAELAAPDQLQVRGFFPDVIRVNFRVAPDLFAWRSPGVPMALKYRFTGLPLSKSSTLNVNINDGFVRALQLDEWGRKLDGKDLVKLPVMDRNTSYREDLVYIPPHQIYGRDQLQLHYHFELVKEGECADHLPDNLQGAVDPDSVLDFSSFPHYVAMPNLAHFAKLGFPFTRLADLSETAVVMPDQPTLEEISVYLMTMGRMGESTGYPVLRHLLVSASEVDKVANRELLVIGTAEDQGLMTKWADHLPLVLTNGEHKLREPDIFRRMVYRWEEEDVQATPRPDGNLNLKGMRDIAALMAFESPLKSGRSVVLLYADKAANLLNVADALFDPDRLKNVQGDLVLVDERGDRYAKIAPTYYVGSLPWITRLHWWSVRHPLIAGFLGVLIAVLLAVLAFRALRVVAAKRLPKKDA